MLRDLLSAEEWLITESGLDLGRLNTFETLFTVGNGLIGTRGALEEGHRGELSGTYLAGVYDSYDAAVIDLVNAPDWLSLAVFVDGVRLDIQTCSVVSHERALDLRRGLLWRQTIFADAAGRRTRLESLRIASMHDPHLCAVRMEVTAENHSSPIVVETALDGHRRNLDRLPVYADGTAFDPDVRWDKWAHSKHLVEVGRRGAGDRLELEMQTIDSRILLSYAASTASPTHEAAESWIEQRSEWIALRARYALAQGEPLCLDKLVTIYTSRDSPEPGLRSRAALDRHRERGFDACIADSERAWQRLWRDCDCSIIGDPDATKAVRFGIYQLLIAANPHDPTVNIGAKSLTGEGYRGHVFWDTEVLLLPFFVFTRPETARTLLRYRHHTLPAARELAKESGLRGARYPWESADTGREECPIWTNDGSFRFWSRDEEIHVTADVAHGVVSYVDATGDVDFLLHYGAEILFESARFWHDRAEPDRVTGRCSITQVMGPDEFHSHVDDNAFTNRLAQWNLEHAARVYRELSADRPDRLAEIASRIGLQPVEVEQWLRVAEGLRLEIDVTDPVIEQFAGYFDRLDVPITSWDENDMPRYPAGYHHFNCEDTMLLKQPDVIMLLHMLPDDFDRATKLANFEFYEARTLHKSSLSPAIHAIMGIEVGDAARAVQYFRRSAFVDLADNQGNTHEGIHIASAGGTWQALVCGFGGFRVRHGQPHFDPWLPDQWQGIRFRLHWRGHAIDVTVEHGAVTLTLDAPADQVVQVCVAGSPVRLVAGEERRVALA